MAMDQILRWMGANLGDLLTVLGIVLTLVELRRTKSAVEASNLAAARAFNELSSRSAIAEIATIRTGFREAQVALRGMRLEAALLRLQEVRERLHGLRSKDSFNTDARLGAIQQMVFSLHKMQARIELQLADSSQPAIPVARMNTQMGEFAAEVAAWQEEQHYRQESDKP
jgi:hypothetical protein